jgi:hypothetical protein
VSHTRGPWELDTAKDRDGRYHIVNGPIPSGINPEFGYPVCDTSNRHHCITPKEDAANARLIAAAPELLEALKRVIYHPLRGATPEREREFWEEEKALGRGDAGDWLFALAVIAKATGGTE